MCGIAGFLAEPGRLNADRLNAAIVAMTHTLAHRGPDDWATWTDIAAGIALGHRRLAILDLSPAGRQPMVCSQGRYVIVYNGEIYNFKELRDELLARGQHFRGHSDTEVLLAGVTEWGLDVTLDRSNGMFAFGLWDRAERTLTLVRDRVGKKPLYYGACNEGLMFASELKAFHAIASFDRAIDRDALGLFIQYGWVPAPFSIFKSVRKLPPGSRLTLRAGDDIRAARPVAFWSAWAKAERAARDPFKGSFDEAISALEPLLKDAVRSRMVADVPLGALLSGGIDSSIVVALMQSVSDRPVKTFSIGFAEEKYNEAPHAAAIARYLGTEHHELYVTARDGLAVVPELPRLYDEPFADPSQIPTYLVSRLARGGVTVALSGDGGDELFAGYSSYGEALARWRRLPPLPHWMRQGMAAGCDHLAQAAWRWRKHGKTAERQRQSRLAKLAKHVGWLAARSPLDLFIRRKARITPASTIVIEATDLPYAQLPPSAYGKGGEPVKAMMALDFVTYLVDDVLVKVDRASMGVGLEVRCPLLDWRVVERAWSLPLPMLLDPSGGGKRVLRALLARFVPPALTDRPKAGFGVPIASWLRGPLRAWAETLLDETGLSHRRYLHPAAVGRLWRQHLNGWQNHEQVLWNILMFEAWYNQWLTPQRSLMPIPVDARACDAPREVQR